MSEAFKRWYELHKAELAEKRKKRYQEDPEYNQAVKDQAAESRKKALAGKKKPVDKVRVKSRDVEAFQIGKAQLMCGVDGDKMRVWSAKGIMPMTPFRSYRGFLLFTRSMLDVIAKSIASREGKRVIAEDKGFFVEVYEGWVEAGISRRDLRACQVERGLQVLEEVENERKNRSSGSTASNG